MRQWRHLKMLMRGGRGNDGERNVKQTKQGELAVDCPACPHPDINLPADWNDPSRPDRYVEPPSLFTVPNLGVLATSTTCLLQSMPASVSNGSSFQAC